MRLSWRVAAFLAAAVVITGQGAMADDMLATAPIDPAMFRDGEVRRTHTTYGTWTLVCDAIPRLGHRFCSLSAAPAPLGGSAAVTLTVSTGDDGRPAALLHLPLGLSLPPGARIKALGAGRDRAERRIAVALCSAVSCEAVWSLSAGEIAALHAGPGMRITAWGWRFGLPGRQDRAATRVTATIDGRGFAEAVAASLR